MGNTRLPSRRQYGCAAATLTGDFGGGMSQRSASRSCVLALSWHPDVAGCESAGGQCSPTTMSPRPERRDARELRRLDGEGRGARGAEPLVCPPGDDVSLASAMSLPPMSSSSLRRWAEPGEIGEATALPGRGPRALAREGIPGRAGKRASPGPTRDSTTMTLMRPLSPTLCGARAAAACSRSAPRFATRRAPRRPMPLQDAGRQLSSFGNTLTSHVRRLSSSLSLSRRFVLRRCFR
jgi:hypothetical protein